MQFPKSPEQDNQGEGEKSYFSAGPTKLIKVYSDNANMSQTFITPVMYDVRNFSEINYSHIWNMQILQRVYIQINSQSIVLSWNYTDEQHTIVVWLAA